MARRSSRSSMWSRRRSYFSASRSTPTGLLCLMRYTSCSRASSRSGVRWVRASLMGTVRSMSDLLVDRAAVADVRDGDDVDAVVDDVEDPVVAGADTVGAVGSLQHRGSGRSRVLGQCFDGGFDALALDAVDLAERSGGLTLVGHREVHTYDTTRTL